jgi:hypothetical protein
MRALQLVIFVAVAGVLVAAVPDQGRRRKVKKIVGPTGSEAAGPDTRAAEPAAETPVQPGEEEKLNSDNDDSQKSPRG